ncbi:MULTISPECIES: flagellar assembly protein FliW [Paenibacillus]|uniref:Flagellar assembly factor FliW n=1 Tax=Paenibacillus glycanilyticus TaxID=126569 RepID=A0ABQ6NUD0_9BACL|nr:MULTISPECIES: flagellar assembly protein FliW [Paenibacillus]MCK9858075.1 flagellar assembly protein FliW [Paenibacillus sp. ATY16]GMK48696.1 flagellar assembly factor FliW [Paenibacillus glycanilyticus]
MTTYQFDNGIPGFEHLQQFVLSEVEGEMPVRLMQSVEDENIAFLIASPFFFYNDYEWDLPDSVVQELKLDDEKDVEVWSVVTLNKDPNKSTINLLAPIVLNKKTKRGKQHIIHDHAYSSRAPLYQA